MVKFFAKMVLSFKFIGWSRDKLNAYCVNYKSFRFCLFCDVSVESKSLLLAGKKANYVFFLQDRPQKNGVKKFV
jgi:hypothetical protein